MRRTRCAAAFFIPLLWASASVAAGHPGRAYIEKNGYRGPATCEECHPGKAREFLGTVHWQHASRVDKVDNLAPGEEYGMKNRFYSFCDGSDIVNDLKETPPNAAGKTKMTGCNTCHPGDHLSKEGSSGPAAEAAVDCLICHSSEYDFRLRKPTKNGKGEIVMGQDRTVKAALAIAKPNVKNCMTCHESAGGGVYIKRGFVYTAQNDVHAAKGMVCVDCHKTRDHRIPTGFDPNTWASDGVRVVCEDCHGEKPHKDDNANRHTARIACQTCHIPRTGGAYSKDFTRWTLLQDGFYEPTTLKRNENETLPVYAWYNKTVRNEPHFIGPKGSRSDKGSKIYPFKIYQAKAYFNKLDGKLLAMDFAPPMATGDTLAGVASAAKTMGLKDYQPVPGWQTIYFASSHLVTREKALSCEKCHAPQGVLKFSELGYSAEEVERLTSPAVYFEEAVRRQEKEEF